MITKTVKELHRVVEGILRAAGTPADNAAVVADLLVNSHAAGHDSHGIQHLARYINEVRGGEIVPAARPEIVSETGAATLVRGNWAWGHVTAEFVTRVGIRKAKQNKVALVAAVEVNHIGRLGDFAEKAAAEGVISIINFGGMAEEGTPFAAPYGGARGVLAPNPIALGFPTAGGPPVMLDIATTRAAGGKIALARAKGQKLPAGWILDKHGTPSTDPEAYFDGGSLLPFGEHKGFGIMVAAEILSRILAGSDAYSNTARGGKHFRHAGMSLIAIDSGAFSPAGDFAARTSELAQRIRAVPPAQGFSEVMAPGDFEDRMRSKRLREGLEIPESTWNEVVQTARSLGLEVD